MRFPAIVSAAILAASTLSSFASSFHVESERKSGDWAAVLYRNTSGNRLFCALESYDGGTVFRVVKYKDSGDTFLEIYNPDWNLIEGDAKFELELMIGSEAYGAELMGKREATAYTHDFTENDTYLALLGMISQSSKVTVKNSNGAQIVSFNGRGSQQALADYGSCSKSE